MPFLASSSVTCNRGSANEPGRPASARSSRCRIVSRCFIEGGTYSTMSWSNVTSPTRSRCWLEKNARHAAR